MSTAEKEAHSPRLRMLPHQIALLDTVLEPAGKWVTLLRSDVGLGKSTALVALSKRLLRERPTARVLLIVPKALQLHYGEMLRDESTPALLVDRYKFREMLDSTSTEEIWPRGVILVLSVDFAKQPDIQNSLANASWELVIADEAQMFTGMRGETLRRIAESAERVVLATATLADFEWLGVNAFAADSLMSVERSHVNIERSDAFSGITVVEWKRNRIVDHDGKIIDTAPRPVIIELSFTLTPKELSLRAVVTRLCDDLENASSRRSQITKSILHHLESSTPAVESILRRISERSGPDSRIETPLESMEEDSTEEEETMPNVSSSGANQISEALVNILEPIDELSIDSKLEAFGQLLRHLQNTKGPSLRICVLTDYLATLFYLAAEIEERGMKYVLLHGGSSVEDRNRAWKSLTTVKSVLIATRAAMVDGLAAAEVTDVVLYDVPDNKIALEQSLGRFDQFGRKAQLTIHVLVPSNVASGVIFESLQALRNVFASEDKSRSSTRE